MKVTKRDTKKMIEETGTGRERKREGYTHIRKQINVKMKNHVTNFFCQEEFAIYKEYDSSGLLSRIRFTQFSREVSIKMSI